MKTVYIIKGEVTDPSAYGDRRPTMGDTEWQFSDGLPGERFGSADFLTLEEGFEHFARHHGDESFCFVWLGEYHELCDGWAVVRHADGSAKIFHATGVSITMPFQAFQMLGSVAHG